MEPVSEIIDEKINDFRNIVIDHLYIKHPMGLEYLENISDIIFCAGTSSKFY